MKLWEKLSKIIFRLFVLPYTKIFEENSPEKTLRNSLKVLDPDAIKSLKVFVKSSQTGSGGFKDRAGNPDLYYTLFGFYIAEALGMKEMLPSINLYTEQEIKKNNLEGVNLYCAAIISSRLNGKYNHNKLFRSRIHNPDLHRNRQPVYSSFIKMLACYYLRDYSGLFKIRKQLSTLEINDTIPSPVIAAFLVLQTGFNKPGDDIKQKLFSFYDRNEGFKATKTAPVCDLLSTGVALYALKFSGTDLRLIKPDCLKYVDSLFTEGGFGSNVVDYEPDIEYTFYGLLALGSLA